MFTSFAGTSSSSRKRKNKEVVNDNGERTAQNTPEFPSLQLRSSQSDPPQSNNQQQSSQVVSTNLTLTNQNDVNERFLRLFCPDSSRLTQPQNGASAAADARLRHHITEMQELIHAQTHHMQTGLSNMWRAYYQETIAATEESMEKRLRAKEAELEKSMHVAEQWEVRARALEQTVSSLKTVLRKTMADVSMHCDDGGNIKEGEAESSYVDPRRAEGGPPQLPCNICRTKSATVMIWPCRHVTVCVKCEKLTSKCPLCRSPKDSCLHVFIA